MCGIVLRRALVAIGLSLLAALTAPPGAMANGASADDASADGRLAALVEGPQRTDKNRARDAYRHPLETLAFFGLRNDATVVEMEPGGAGWWTEILAPYLRDKGQYIAVEPPLKGRPAEAQASNDAFAAKLAADPALYGKVTVTQLAAPDGEIAPPASADFVLTFRNLHNWIKDGTADAMLAGFYRALKPGGVLGIEDHRAADDQPQDPQAINGYVREDYAIALAEKAGFTLAGRSEINANPKDTKDYPAGVWTLPPTYRLKDQDHARYEAIGESDRFTLKFVKPRV